MKPSDTGSSLALYRALLILYPRRFRVEYGTHLVQLFGDCLRDARRHGLPGIAQLWLATLLDLVKSALEERTRKGSGMTREQFTRLSGPFLMLGGAFWLLSLFGQLETRYDDPLGGPDRLYELAGALWAPALLLLFMGLLGFLLRYGPDLGRLARVFLVIAGLASLTGATGSVVMTMELARVLPGETGYFVFIFSLWALLGSLVILGGIALVRRPLSRWNGLPLAIGALPFSMFLVDSRLFNGVVMGAFAVAWILFGYVVRQDDRLRAGAGSTD